MCSGTLGAAQDTCQSQISYISNSVVISRKYHPALQSPSFYTNCTALLDCSSTDSLTFRGKGEAGGGGGWFGEKGRLICGICTRVSKICQATQVCRAQNTFGGVGREVVSKAAQANGASRGLKGNGILGERWG